MKKMIVAALLAAGVAGSASAAYQPVGVQTNVALSTVTSGGWTQCYVATMGQSIGGNASSVLNACHGDLLMMAGRATGSSTLLVLADALLSDTVIDTGQTSITHLSNGANWYYSPNWSWGFTAAGDTVQNNQCDVGSSPTSMCLHTLAGVGGYRINDITGLNDSTAYEKIFFVASLNAAAVPEPTSIALLTAGLMGVAALRRKSKQKA